MRILQIKLRNFRQFFGDTPAINLEPHSRTRNVVLFHGMNGAGKTAILNAFTWALYGDFPRESGDWLVNKRAMRDAPTEEIDAWVKVVFSHGDHMYEIHRTMKARLDKPSGEWRERSQSDVSIMSNNTATGQGWKRENARMIDEIVGRILPKDLYGYFFFDGERIERIVQKSRAEREELGKATRTLLGVEVLVRAERHLDTVRKQFEKSLRKIGDPKTQELLDRKGEFEDALRMCTVNRNQEVDNIVAFEKQIEDIEAELASIKSTAALQARRRELESDWKSVEIALQGCDDKMASLVSGYGYTVFMSEAVTAFSKVRDELIESRELPSGIKRQFVEELLRDEICICSRSLGDDAPAARDEVRQWKEKAGPVDVERRLFEMGAEALEIRERGAVFHTEVEGIKRDRLTHRERMGSIELELESISESLKDSHEVDVAALEERRQVAADACSEAQRAIGRLEVKESQLGEEIKRVDNKIEEHEAMAEEQRVLKEQALASGQARRRIIAERKRLEVALREKVLRRLKSLFAAMTVTPYEPVLKEDWTLELVEAAGGSEEKVAPSSGENQVLSLAFIASIVGQIRDELANEENAHLYLGAPERAEYPMVMDSPFGTLDPHHRRQVAEQLPEIVDQIILLVTNTQWYGEVEKGLGGRIARRYLLSYHTTRDDVEMQPMMIDGERYELVRRSPDNFEYTKIVEVS